MSGQVRQRVLRLVPDAGSGETIAPVDVARSLGMTVDAVDQHLSRAARGGFVVRERVGAYVLASRPPARPLRAPRSPVPARFKDPGAPQPAAALTAAEAAVELGVHEETVRDWCHVGRLGSGQVRRWARLRIAPTDLRRFLEGRAP